MSAMDILAAIALVLMLVVLGPRAMSMMRHSPKGSKDDWINAVIPIGGVVIFVWLLTKLV